MAPQANSPNRFLLAALLLLALPLFACDQTPALEEVRGQLEEAAPGLDLVPEDNLHFGRLSLGLARWLVGRDDAEGSGGAGERQDRGASEDHEGRRLLRAIHHLDLATYRVRSMPQGLPKSWLPEFEERLVSAGWSLIVHAADNGEQTWVFYRTEAGAISDLYLVSLESSELTLLRLKGRFDEAMAHEVMPRHAKGLRALAPPGKNREPALAASAAPLGSR